MNASQDLRFSRLPKWAQQDIERLERDLHNRTVQYFAALHAAGFKPDRYYGLVSISERAVRWLLAGDRVTEMQVMPSDDGRALDVMSADGGRLSVEPEVSNRVTIRVLDR